LPRFAGPRLIWAAPCEVNAKRGKGGLAAFRRAGNLIFRTPVRSQRGRGADIEREGKGTIKLATMPSGRLLGAPSSVPVPVCGSPSARWRFHGGGIFAIRMPA